MLTLTRKKQPKLSYLRNAEYYNFQDVLDNLYSDSEKNLNFNSLMKYITCEENIKLAYRNIKKNSGSKTAGVDKKTIDNLKKWETKDLLNIYAND